MATMRQTVKILEAQGNKVTFVERSDGGIRITSINGQKFKGSAGNKVARAMTGTWLPEHIEQQLAGRKFRHPTGKGSRKRRKTKTPLPKDLKRALVKLQKEWNKHIHDITIGKPTTSNIRYILETEGKEAALQKINEMMKYTKGIAYSQNVEAVMDRLSNTMRRFSPDLQARWQAVIDKLDEIKDDLQLTSLNNIIRALYDKNMSEEQRLETIEELLGL